MCGRYELHTQPAALALAFGVPFPPQMRPRYNIAPMQDVPIVRRNAAGERELVNVRWGLVPRWAKDPAIGNRMINARAETLAEKPSFRTALKRHRCLLPTDGFYEWKQTASGGKQPIHIGMKDARAVRTCGAVRALAVAGRRSARHLHDHHDAGQCAAVAAARPHAGDHRAGRVRPLAGCRERGHRADLFAPYPADAMTYYPVSPRVNSVQNDDASLIVRVDEAGGEARPRTNRRHRHPSRNRSFSVVMIAACATAPRT